MRKDPQSYHFNRFPELCCPDGFRYPIDVYTGNIFLGTLEVLADGVTVSMVQTPHTNIILEKHPRNKHRTEQAATQALHDLWRNYRQPEVAPQQPR